jgi:hypothetical protein
MQMLHHSRRIVGVMIHVVAFGDLCRASVPAAIVRHHTVALVQEEQHLRIRVVGRKRPAVTAVGSPAKSAVDRSRSHGRHCRASSTQPRKEGLGIAVVDCLGHAVRQCRIRVEAVVEVSTDVLGGKRPIAAVENVTGFGESD